ncbi:MAG: hypothetical protein HUU18_12510 [Phycisphaerales bacterium]|nr:hypothetical protein [Phycisphaerales bacterium]
MKTPEGTKHYFVDEAGDATLFNARGVAIVGMEGVSHTFMVGVADVPDPTAARAALDALRASLLADPYFKGVPSMAPDGGKTAVCFHAKDDLPEVRREVFKLLQTLGVKVQVAIRRKSELIEEARAFHAMGRRLDASDVYDDLVKRLFRNLLHRGEAHEVCFARRGKSDRQQALTIALKRAKENFRRAWKADLDLPCSIRASVPSADAGLQVIDYYLWALQRFMERDEDRYFAAVADQFRFIMDLDDKRAKAYGRLYNDKDPLTLAKKKPLTS